MFSYIKYIVTGIVVSALLHGCAGAPVKKQTVIEMPNLTNMEELQDAVKPTKRTKPPELGMVHIERHTAGYTISMTLDATDDNVYFVMDLPEQDGKEPLEKNSEEKAQGPERSKDATTTDTPSVPPTPSDETQASKHLVYAQTYFFEKKYARALDEINRTIQYSPNSAVAYSLKGSIHYKRSERDAARTAWEKALELDPNQENVSAMLEKLK